MKKILLINFLLLSNILFAQTSIRIDNMEDIGWTWKGQPKVLINSSYVGGFSTLTDNPPNSSLFVSSDTSFRLLAIGTGSSAIEKDTLFYSNIVGLDPSIVYRVRFRVASIAIDATVNAAAGVDGTDYVQLEYSSNGGGSYQKEIKLVGSSNARWNFSNGTTINKNANGLLTNFISTTASPISTVELNLPIGINQLSVLIILVANANGESWFIDDVELLAVSALPVELLHFSGTLKNKSVELEWVTASETNNDYFIISKSTNGFDFIEIGTVDGSNTTTNLRNYNFIDYELFSGIIYYKLSQVDYDGTKKDYFPIAINNRVKNNKTVKLITNFLGQTVDGSYGGLKFYHYDDNTIEVSY